MSIENKNKLILEEAIIRVVAFFDLFNYPLTALEAWQYNRLECSFSEVEKKMDKLTATNYLEFKQGFYFLPERVKNISIRVQRKNYFKRKMRRAQRFFYFLRLIPWIEMIAIANIIGANNLKDESDIDFFIITQKKRVWLTRLISASLAAVLGLRPRPGDTRDKICLSFYISEEGMDLKNLMLGDGEDIYFIYWLVGLTIIYDKGGIYEKFIRKNLWIKKYLPNWQPDIFKKKIIKSHQHFYCHLVDLLLCYLEKTVQKWQIKKFPLALKNIMNKDTRVVINNKIIKLHTNDRREEYRKAFKSKNIV